MARTTITALLVALACSCAPKEISYSVSIISSSCDPDAKPFEGAVMLRIKITGDGIEPITSISDFATGSLTIPNIPAGLKRQIEVRAYDGNPTTGANVISVGKSVPFDVPEAYPEVLMGSSVQVNIVMRKIGSFNKPVNAALPTNCTTMNFARAGHTATLLDDGRVFIAGGYKMNGLFKDALASTEIYDPGTGLFDNKKPISYLSTSGDVNLPKAFHTATKLPNGQVLLWGGETYQQQNEMPTNIPVMTSTVLAYDVADRYISVRGANGMAMARSRHSAALDGNGMVVVAGGVSRVASAEVPADKVEFFVGDPTLTDRVNKYYTVDGLSLPRRGAKLAALNSPQKNADYVAVVGGTDDTAMTNEVVFLRYDVSTQTFKKQELSTPLRMGDPGRRSAGLAQIQNGNGLIALGGYSDPKQNKTVETSEIISTKISAGPTIGKRGDVCAVTLDDGSVIAIGGRKENGAGTISDGTSSLLTADPAGEMTVAAGPTLSTPRWAHTCTLLSDGTVLVLGGINEKADGSSEILNDAWIYQPAVKAD